MVDAIPLVTENSECNEHEVYSSEWTTNNKGEYVLICQKCYKEIRPEDVRAK